MPPLVEISASDFRQHFGTYMRLVENQDFQVTRNGKVIGLWTNPNRARIDLAESLAGSIHASVDEEEDRSERISHL